MSNKSLQTLDIGTSLSELSDGVVRTDSSGDRFVVPDGCRDALAKLEARLTPDAPSR